MPDNTSAAFPVNTTPIFLTVDQQPLDYHAAATACREATIAMTKTHQFFVQRYYFDGRNGFVVLARRRLR